MRQVGHLPELDEDARSEKNIKFHTTFCLFDGVASMYSMLQPNDETQQNLSYESNAAYNSDLAVR